jgi:integrase
MPLTDPAIKSRQAEAKPVKLSDGSGLYLLLQPNGAKYWRLKYRFAGKEKTLSLGVYPEVSLKNAREGRTEARKLLANGADPSASKQAAKRTTGADVRNSFAKLSAEYHALKSPSWTTGHSKQWLLNMERYALPVLGHCGVADIEPLQVLEVLRNMEAKGTFETRDRLGQSIGAVFKYAIATGRAKYNPAADIRTALTDSPKAKNFACLAPAELPDFLCALTDYQSRAQVSPIAVSATRLLMLTATRTSEVRFAKWRDFDLDAAVWVIPEEQTGRKGKQGKRKSHTVPLSSQAVAILRDLYPITGQGAQVFPNRNDTTRVISENTVLKVIEGMGYKGKMTGHGFRSLARSLLAEMGHRSEVLEAMLSHSIENATEAAYVRTTYLEERRGIMQHWADYLRGIEAVAVVIRLRA